MDGQPPAMPDHICIAYHDAIENIMHIKRERWSIVYYAGVSYAALVSLGVGVPSACPAQGACEAAFGPNAKLALAMAGTLAWLLSMLLLWAQRQNLSKFRKRIRDIYSRYFSRYFTAEEREALDLHGKVDVASHWTSAGFLAVTTMGWGVSVGGLKRHHFQHATISFLEWFRNVLLAVDLWFYEAGRWIGGEWLSLTVLLHHIAR